MTKLNNNEICAINGGGTLRDIYEDVRYLVTEAIPDFVDGFLDGWRSC